ncbi:MAG TPA: VOC family protein [Mucilaginibacter sp.]
MFRVILTMVLATALITSYPKIKYKQAPGDHQSSPVLVNTCLITKNVRRLIQFYSNILQLPAKITGSDYAEFATGVGIVAIFSANAQEKYIPRSAVPAVNKSVILEFRVEHVDKEYIRLGPWVKTWIKPPTTQPWGTRSIYFRDPDGNLINFYEVLKP